MGGLGKVSDNYTSISISISVPFYKFPTAIYGYQLKFPMGFTKKNYNSHGHHPPQT